MRHEQISFHLGYLPALDGLRGVAVLMVMFHHAPFGLARGGFLGVDVFFVLSGFLITTLLLQERARSGSISLRQFYARRGLRLLPALVVLLAATMLLPLPLVSIAVPRWKVVLPVLFYSANWVLAFGAVDLDTLNPTWSLAIEEQFYLLWPPVLALLLALNVGRRWLAGLVLLGIAGAVVRRVMLWDALGSNAWLRVYYGLDTRLDALLLGCLVALVVTWDLLPHRPWARIAVRWATVPAGLVLLVLFFAAPPPDSQQLYEGPELLGCVAAAILILALVASPPPLLALVLEDKGLVWVGRVSYGLYLWHVPVFHGLLNPRRLARLGLAGPIVTLLRFATAGAVAGLSFHLVEQPMLRLKERFRPNRGDVT